MNISRSETIPLPPDDFSELEKQIYFDTTSELFAAGIFQKIGLPVIIMYCSYMATAIDAEQKLRKTGRVFRAKNQHTGEITPRVSPYHRISLEAFDAARKIMSEFGITPASQSRLAGLMKGEEKPGNPFLNI